MRTKSPLYFKLALSILLLIGIQVHAQQINNITSGYVANTFSGDNGKWVQNFAEELDVASDGTMITASGWDEAGRCIGVFKDGQPIAYLKQYNNAGGHNCWGWGTASEAIAVTDSYLYVNNCDGDILLFNRSKNYFYESKVNSGVAKGMTATATDLYLIKADGTVQKRSVSNLGTVTLTFTVVGGHDLAIDKNGNIWILTVQNEVLKYNSAGVYTGTKIAAQSGWLPFSVNYDAFNDLLLIADNGPRRQVIKFNTAATQVGTFGDLGGISAGNKGTVGDLRFWKISGCGTDANGNIYVALSEGAVSLRKFNSSGIKQWEVQGMMFSDIASIDPASDGTDIYGVNEHMKYDYQAQKWSLVSLTNDRISYPNDPRNDGAGSHVTCALMRRVNGKLIMFTSGMMAGKFDVYRFDGEIAVLCKTFDKLEWAAFPDKNGNIWYLSNWSSIKKIPLTGFTSDGSPIFGPEVSITASLPSPFNEILRLEYDVDTDVMYIGGFTNEKPDPKDGSWGLVGSTVARYPNWNKGGRTATHSVVIARDVENFYLKAMSVAGDYIFIAGSRDRGKLYVYKSATMEFVGTIEAPTNMGEIGWIDMVYAVQAFKNSNGNYLVLVEDNSKGKNILYQWNGVISTEMVTSNGQDNAGEGLVNLTDGNLNSKWVNLSPTAWVQFSYIPPIIWNKYEITSSNDPPRDPKNWTIQASNDGVNWTTLDTRTNQNWAEINTTKSYTFNNTKAYSYYRWDISSNNGNVYLQSSEFTFSGPTLTAVENGNELLTRIYPNPAKTELYITGSLTENTSYEITTIEGKSLQAGAVRSGSISIANIKEGLYFLKIKYESGETVQRFVKE